MKTLLIIRLFQIVNKTICKHSHKKRKVYCIIDMLGYPNYNAQGVFVIIFFTYSDLYNCLRSLCTVAVGTENEKKKENPHYKQPFCCFDVFPVRPPQKFQVQAKIPTIRPVFLYYFPVSLWICCKTENLCDKRGCLLPWLKMMYTTVWILLLLNFS